MSHRSRKSQFKAIGLKLNPIGLLVLRFDGYCLIHLTGTIHTIQKTADKTFYQNKQDRSQRKDEYLENDRFLFGEAGRHCSDLGVLRFADISRLLVKKRVESRPCERNYTERNPDYY
jgi:hypothetical protein